MRKYSPIESEEQLLPGIKLVDINGNFRTIIEKVKGGWRLTHKNSEIAGAYMRFDELKDDRIVNDSV